MANRPREILNLFWTTAGICPGDGEISPRDFTDRVRSAARAGFTGIGLWHTDLEHVLVHRSLREMRSILDDNGMTQLELEFLTDWFVDGARRSESDSRRRRLLEASAALNATHVKVGDFYRTPCPLPRLVDSFAALCEEARRFGATIGFEFMPSSMVSTFADACQVVVEAGAPNGGLILDIVHVMNRGISCEQIRQLPLRHLVGVELNDGWLPGSPNHDPSGDRRFCGEGEYDIRGFIQCVQSIGFTGPWAVEVFSRELAGLPLDELNARAYQTTMAQFDSEAPRPGPVGRG